MKNIWAFVAVFILVVVLGFLMFSFQVRQTESAIVTRFGKHVDTKTEPGLYFRLPEPIHVIKPFDSRSRIYEGILEETTTAGGEPIIVLSYVVWRIEEPLTFYTSVRDIDGAEKKLRDLLRNAQNSVIGEHYFNEFVNTDQSKIQFEEIENEIAEFIRPQALESYGIGIRSAGLKRLMINEKVTEKVFARMKSDRQGKASAIRAAGEAEAERIKSDADAKRKELLAFAKSQAQAVRGAGDAEAARYYKDLEKDPELAMFLRDLETLKIILKDRTTIVLGTDVEPIQLLKQVPEMKPKQ